MQQHGQTGHRALLHWRPCETLQRRPDGRLLVRANGNTLVQQATFHPLGGPGAVAGQLDLCERLEGNAAIGSQVVMFAAQAQNGGAHRAAHIKRKDARTGITAELHRQCGQQHRLAHAGRPHDEGVPHVVDVRYQSERCSTIGTGNDQRRAIQVIVPLRPRPYRRHRHQVRQVQRRDDGLAHIRVGITGNGREPGVNRVECFGNGDKTTALNHTLDHAPLLVGQVGIRVHHGDRGRQVAESD